MFSSTKLCLLLAACALLAEASSFLSRAHGDEAETMNAELQSTIMQKVEEMLGKDKSLIEGRLSRIESQLRTTFNALPKNADGKLEHGAVRYALHSYFVQRHGWYVRGLSDVGDGFSGNSGNGTLQDRVEEFVQGVFEQKVGAHGLDLRQMATLAATFENLVRDEMMQRLSTALDVLKMSSSQELSASDVDTVLDTYMMSYIVRFNLTARSLQYVKERIHNIYPAWAETQQFLRSVRENSGGHRSFFQRTDVEELLGQVADQYGRWQDKECKDLKHQLVAIEDRTIGTNGSGRVRIADFYGSAVNDGNWQFRETQEYLSQLGALDTTDANVPRVIIPNYVNSPSNCLAGSKYYSVCCINECEDLIDSLEHRFQMPSAAPSDIIEAVSSLPSSTVPAGRSLPPVMVSRLDDIAKQHGGQVPLHGRMFSQWMHHAYPRECPYPHMSGTIRPQRSREYTQEKGVSPTIAKEELAGVVKAMQKEQASSDAEGSEDCTTWSHEEELYVSGHAVREQRPLRLLAYLSIVMAALLTIGRQAASSSKVVAFAAGAAGGKDIFV